MRLATAIFGEECCEPDMRVFFSMEGVEMIMGGSHNVTGYNEIWQRTNYTPVKRIRTDSYPRTKLYPSGV